MGIRIIRRYFARQVFQSVVLVLLFFLSLDFLLTLMEQLDDLSETYIFWDATYYVLLKLPAKSYFYLPSSVLIGTLVSLGFMANHSELTVLRSAGISLLGIFWLVLRPIIVFAFIALATSQWLIPFAERSADALRHEAKGYASSLDVRKGVWQRDGNSFYHIEVVKPDGQLQGVTKFDVDQQGQLKRVAQSKTGKYIEEQWHVYDTVESQLQSDAITTSAMTHEILDTHLSANLFQRLSLGADFHAPTHLWGYVQELKVQGERYDVYELAFWRKVLQPFVITIMVLIALSFIFGPLRSVTTGARIVAGVVAGLIYTYFQEVFVQVGLVSGFPAVLSVGIPIVLCGIVGLLLFRRAA